MNLVTCKLSRKLSVPVLSFICSAMVVCTAKACLSSNIPGNLATNCLISCTVFSVCRSSNCELIKRACFDKTGPT